MGFERSYKLDPYKSMEADAYVTAINILAVEYLIKTNNVDEYAKRCEQVSNLDRDDLLVLYINLSLNMHTSSLGAMITHGDYEMQREHLLHFLDQPENRYSYVEED